MTVTGKTPCAICGAAYIGFPIGLYQDGKLVTRICSKHTLYEAVFHPFDDGQKLALRMELVPDDGTPRESDPKVTVR